MADNKHINKPLVAIIIVNFNGGDLLLDALQSIKELEYAAQKIVVVDNGSTDASIEIVAQRFPEVSLILNDENLGFARASNQGLKFASEINAQYVMFFNNDATLASNCLNVLVNTLEDNSEAVAAAPFIFYDDKPDVIWYGGGVIRLWRGWVGHRYLRKLFRSQSAKVAESDYLTGCIFLGRTHILTQLDGFDESYSLYSEDVDLSLRLRKDGWKLLVNPDAQGYHKVSATAGGEMSPFKAFHRGRSMAMIVKRFVKLWEIPTLITGGIIGGVITSLKLIVTGKGSSAFALWRGIIHGMLNLELPVKYQLRNRLCPLLSK